MAHTTQFYRIAKDFLNRLQPPPAKIETPSSSQKENETPIRDLLIESKKAPMARPIPASPALLRSLCRGKGVLQKEGGHLFLEVDSRFVSMLAPYLALHKLKIPSRLQITVVSERESFFHYTESDSRIGSWQGGALNLDQAKLPLKAYGVPEERFVLWGRPLQPNLKRLGDAGGAKFSGCPTMPEPILESRAVYIGQNELIGKEFHFELEGLYSTPGSFWSNTEETWHFKVKSQEIQALRKALFLPSIHLEMLVGVKSRPTLLKPVLPLPLMKINPAFFAA